MARFLFVCCSAFGSSPAEFEQRALGGIETCNVELTRALAQRGHEVTLASPNCAPGIIAEVTHIPSHDLSTTTGDVAVVSNNAEAFDTLPSACGAKWLWLHNPLRLEKAFRRRRIGPLWRHRPGVVFVSDNLRSDTFRYPFSRSEVIGHGISAPFLNGARIAPREGTPPRFLWASQRHRGFRETLRLWRERIAPALPNAEFHVLGGGVGDAEGAPRVVFRGPLSKQAMAETYQDARAMLYPGAPDETFCLAAAEAQCAGVPVITLGLGALRERVSHGIDGFLCNDWSDFADKAILLGRDDELAARLSDGARTRRVNRDWDTVAQIWERLVIPAHSTDAGFRQRASR